MEAGREALRFFCWSARAAWSDPVRGNGRGFVVVFAGRNLEGSAMNLRRRLCGLAGGLAGLAIGLGLIAGFPRAAMAQADYPFRDPKLGDDQRIADLLGRLTLEEKILLMSDHPKIPRLGSSSLVRWRDCMGWRWAVLAAGAGAAGSRCRRPRFRKRRDWARPGTRIC